MRTSSLVDIVKPGGSVLERNYGHVGFGFFLLGELNGAVNEGVKGVVLTDADVLVGIVGRSPLAHDDVARLYGFATEFLDSQTLGMGFTSVLGT